jgi:hypothetical protein
MQMAVQRPSGNHTSVQFYEQERLVLLTGWIKKYPGDFRFLRVKAIFHAVHK